MCPCGKRRGPTEEVRQVMGPDMHMNFKNTPERNTKHQRLQYATQTLLRIKKGIYEVYLKEYLSFR